MIKHSLDIYNFPRGILVLFLTLAFFLCRVKYYKSMKIGFTFFGAIFHFLCISKVQALFWKILNRLKRLNTWLSFAHTGIYTEGRVQGLTCGPWDLLVSGTEGEGGLPVVFCHR